MGFSLSGFQRVQPPLILNSWPQLFLSPLAKVLGRYRPSQTTYPISPLEPGISPQSSEVQACADPCLFQEPSCLGPLTNLLPKVSRKVTTHFTDLNIHPFTHQIVSKDISTHISSQIDVPVLLTVF